MEPLRLQINDAVTKGKEVLQVSPRRVSIGGKVEAPIRRSPNQPNTQTNNTNSNSNTTNNNINNSQNNSGIGDKNQKRLKRSYSLGTKGTPIRGRDSKPLPDVIVQPDPECGLREWLSKYDEYKSLPLPVLQKRGSKISCSADATSHFKIDRSGSDGNILQKQTRVGLLHNGDTVVWMDIDTSEDTSFLSNLDAKFQQIIEKLETFPKQQQPTRASQPPVPLARASAIIPGAQSPKMRLSQSPRQLPATPMSPRTTAFSSTEQTRIETLVCTVKNQEREIGRLKSELQRASSASVLSSSSSSSSSSSITAAVPPLVPSASSRPALDTGTDDDDSPFSLDYLDDPAETQAASGNVSDSRNSDDTQKIEIVKAINMRLHGELKKSFVALKIAHSQLVKEKQKVVDLTETNAYYLQENSKLRSNCDVELVQTLQKQNLQLEDRVQELETQLYQ